VNEVRAMASLFIVVVLLHRKAQALGFPASYENSRLEFLTFNFLIVLSAKA